MCNLHGLEGRTKAAREMPPEPLEAVSTLSKGNHGSLLSVCWYVPTWGDLMWKVSCRVKRELQSSTACDSLEVTACLHNEQELPGQGQDSLLLPQLSLCFWKLLLTSDLVNSNAEKSLPQGGGLVPLTKSCSCPFASARLRCHWPWTRIAFLPQSLAKWVFNRESLSCKELSEMRQN